MSIIDTTYNRHLSTFDIQGAWVLRLNLKKKNLYISNLFSSNEGYYINAYIISSKINCKLQWLTNLKLTDFVHPFLIHIYEKQ